MASFYSSVCKIVSGITMSESDEQTTRDYLVKKLVNKKFPIEKETQKLFQNIIDVVNKYPTSQAMDEKSLNEIVNKEINKYNKGRKKKLNPTKYRMMFKIHAMLGSNPLLLQSFVDQYSDEVLNARGVKLTKKEVQDGIEVIPLDRISTNMIQSIYWDIHQTYNSTEEKNFRGIVGNLRQMWHRPTRMADFDPTGGLKKVAMATKAYLGKVTSHVAGFLGTKVKDGMETIYEDIETEITDRELDPNSKVKMVNMFNMIMQGWMYTEHSYIDKITGKKAIVKPERFEGLDADERAKLIKDLGITSQIYIHTKHNKVRDEKLKYNSKYYKYDKNEKVWKYKKTGNVVHDLLEPMLLSDYVQGKSLEKNEKKDFDNNVSIKEEVRFALQAKEINLGLNQREIIRLETQVAKARSIHKQVFKDLVERFKKLEKDYKAEIYRWFPGAKNDLTYRKRVMKAALEGDFSKLDEDDRAAATFLYNTFGKQVLIDPFITGDTTMLEKKDSFPVEYEKNMMFAMYEGLLPDINQQIKNTEDLIAGGKLTLKQKKNALNLKFNLNGQKRKILQNQAMFNDQEIDTYSEKNMYSKRDAKSFQHISNTFDIRNMKLTKDIYSNYLRRMYSTLERGNMAIEVMGGVRYTGGGRAMKDNPHMVDYGIQLMKTVLHKPDAKSNFFGYDFSTSKMHKHFFGKLPLGITEYKLDKYVKSLSAWITGRFLGKPDTALLNRTVIAIKGINYGWDAWKEASDIKKEHEEVIDSFVAETGITDWSDYFTRELVGDLSQTDAITRDESIRVVKAMLDFHMAIKKGVSEANAKKALVEKVKMLAKNTPAIKSMLENVPGEKKLSDKLRSDKENKLLHITNRWASWAITKKYSAFPMDKVDYKILNSMSEKMSEFLKRRARGWAGAKGIEWLNNAIFDIPGFRSAFTMSETEKQMRTDTVVIAMLKLQNSGQLKIHQLEGIDFIAALELEKNKELTTKEGPNGEPSQLDLLKEDKELVKKTARNFVSQTDMQMTTSDVGMYNRAFGGLHTRFTIFIQQKYGHDVKLFKKFYNSMSDDQKRSPMGIRTRTMIKAMVTHGFGKKGKAKMDKLWKENPDLVKLRSFILLQGFTTLFLDLVLFMPFASRAMRYVPFLRNTTFVKIAGGVTSDVISLYASLPLYILLSLMIDEDEERFQNNIYYKLRRIPFLGFGSGVVLDWVFALFSVALDVDDSEKARRAARAVTPILPVPAPASYVLDPFIREGIENLVDD